jgi:hypothetical protein
MVERNSGNQLREKKTMFKLRSVLLGLLTAALVAGCASPGPTGETSAGLVGAWVVTVTRPGGVGKNMLTFSSDGTFFRSGDTHPVLSGGHGAWRRVGDGEFHATYVAFRFDQGGKWIGSTVVRAHFILSPGGNEFTGKAKVSVRDLQDKEVGTSEVSPVGRRIQVEPF